jgi:hypothetical protein
MKITHFQEKELGNPRLDIKIQCPYSTTDTWQYKIILSYDCATCGGYGSPCMACEHGQLHEEVSFAYLKRALSSADLIGLGDLIKQMFDDFIKLD